MNKSLKFTFSKAQRLLTRKEFQKVNQCATRRIGRFIMIDFCIGSLPSPRLGITVSRKFGKSHKRNRFKRIVREAFRLCHRQLPASLELVIRPRAAAEHASTPLILHEILSLCNDTRS